MSCQDLTLLKSVHHTSPVEKSALRSLSKIHQLNLFILNFPGWKENISGIREFGKLPENLKNYIKFIEDQTGIPVTMVSVGPDREETIFRK